MANTLIRIVVVSLLFFNLYNPMVRAEGENLKQGFYLIKDHTRSKDLISDMKILEDMNIPVFLVIDSDEKIEKTVINTVSKTQKDKQVQVLLEDSNNLEKSYFRVKNFDKDIKLSGLYRIEKGQLTYMGKRNISFEIIEPTTDPLEVMLNVKEKNKKNLNQALIIDGEIFNLSTLSLAYKELEGSNLDTKDYEFSFEKIGMRYRIFTSVGDVTMILFYTSIVIFSLAIIVFKKWSKEKFLS